MGIDRLTALSIANNAEVMEVITYGPYAGDEPPNVVGKFGAAICWKEHPHHPGMPLLSAACVYDSAEQAKETMEKLIEQLKADFA